MTLTDSC